MVLGCTLGVLVCVLTVYNSMCLESMCLNSMWFNSMCTLGFLTYGRLVVAACIAAPHASVMSVASLDAHPHIALFQVQPHLRLYTRF